MKLTIFYEIFYDNTFIIMYTIYISDKRIVYNPSRTNQLSSVGELIFHSDYPFWAPQRVVIKEWVRISQPDINSQQRGICIIQTDCMISLLHKYDKSIIDVMGVKPISPLVKNIKVFYLNYTSIIQKIITTYLVVRY